MKNRILLIEDDAQHRTMLTHVLEETGYDVVAAANGRQGYQLFCQQPFTLVITDIFMPETDGLETIFTLKKEFLMLKIIAISGGGLIGPYAGNSSAELALLTAQKLGADCILRKPLNLDQFLAAVAELVQ